MTYDEALAFWFAHVNFEQRTAVSSDLGLERMRSLLACLGNPHRRLRFVHVAGSKGKGSTSAMLAAIFQQAGYRTGLFTSPHLCRIEERFQVDGKPIARAELVSIIEEIHHAINHGPSSRQFSPSNHPTFFDIATAIGFLHFQHRRADLVVLEVGLGGRLDSTNICSPLLSVITSISYDHTKLLGDRLAMIAREKAGIIKTRRPVVSGVTVPEARSVIEEVAAQRHAKLNQLNVDFQVASTPGKVLEASIVRQRARIVTRARRWPELEVNLLGEHQAENAAVAVAAIEELRRCGLHLSDESVVRGLRQVHWPARMELVTRNPLIVLDCAHNVASAAALVQTLRDSFPPTRRILLFAGSSDKDVQGMFRVLQPYFDMAFLTRYTNNPRWLSPETLSEWWSSVGAVPMRTYDHPLNALAAARLEATNEAISDGLLCITGSVFLAGELRPHLGEEEVFSP